MKIISWNVNGLRAVLKKGFLEFVKKENPDILCLQEIKASKEQVELNINYPYVFWNSSEKKGYSGTLVLSKIKPISEIRKIGHDFESEGRVIALEFENFFLINVYTPNSQRGLLRLKDRKKWDENFLKFLKSLEKKRPVIVCGDFNVAHERIDLANPNANYNKVAGYTQIEIDGFNEIIKSGFVDTFRKFDKSSGKYTYWAQWNNLRARNIGWRIDYFLASSIFMKSIKSSFILKDVMGSDHCPIGVEIK